MRSDHYSLLDGNDGQVEFFHMVNSNDVAADVLSAEFVERLKETLLRSIGMDASDEVLTFQLREVCVGLTPEQLLALRAELRAKVWPDIHRVPVMDLILDGWSWVNIRDWFEHRDIWSIKPPTYTEQVQMKLLGGILRVSPDARDCFELFRRAFGNAQPDFQKKLLEIFRKHAFDIAKQGEREAYELLNWLRLWGGSSSFEKAMFQAATGVLDPGASSRQLLSGFLLTAEGRHAAEYAANEVRDSERLALHFIERILPGFQGARNPEGTPFTHILGGDAVKIAFTWQIDFAPDTLEARVILDARSVLSDRILNELRQIRDAVKTGRRGKLSVSVRVPIDGLPQTIDL